MMGPLSTLRALPRPVRPSRRSLLKGAGALGLAAATAPLFAAPGRAVQTAPGLVLPMTAGPFQNNGASQWSAELAVGSAGQTLKLALDSGSNFIWLTSSLCARNSNLCQHYGGTQFQYQMSSSFQWISTTPKSVDFGPWGSMTVATGRDTVTVAPGQGVPTTFYAAQDYDGSQFAQLDWDGGIGLPSGSEYVDPNVSFFVADLMDAGIVDPSFPYIAFDTDPQTGVGSCRIGGIDPDAFDPASGIRMPWLPYSAYAGLEYLWSCRLDQYTVGGQTLATNKVFCLDSGSSQFKGDDAIMNGTLALIGSLPSKPTIGLTMGVSTAGTPGHLEVPPSVYEVLVQAGPQMGQTVPQFAPLGTKDLVLVGSLIMDLFYTIFEYDVTVQGGRHVLAPVAMYLFDKPGRSLVAGRGEGWGVGRAKPFKKEA